MFFHSLWPSGLQGCKLLIWVNQGEKRKRSIWCDSIEAAEAAVEQWKEFDTYVGLGLVEGATLEAHARQLGRAVDDVRAPATDIRWLPGFWADVDFDGETDHKKHGLPSRQRVEDVLLGEGAEYPPTLVVHSGGGLHLYWLFDEPYEVEHPDEVTALSWGFQEWIRQQLGASMDSTHDLARVLRVPGTWNNKTAPSVRAELITSDGPRWDFEDLAEIARRYPYVERRVAQIGALVIDANAEARTDELMVLAANDPEFSRSWFMKRRDWTPSHYDMSNASRLVHLGWGDQDIVNALIYWRRMHNIEPKLRLDYYQTTLGKVRSTANQAERLEASPGDRESILEEFSALWGVKIQRIVKYGQDGGFGFHIAGAGEVQIPDIQGIIDQRGLQRAIANATNVVIPLRKASDWWPSATQLLSAAEPANLGEESNSRTRIEERIESFLEDYPPQDADETTAISRHAFIKDGLLCISSTELATYLRTTRGEQWKAKELAVHLKAAGWENTVIRAGKPLRVWTRPSHL